MKSNPNDPVRISFGVFVLKMILVHTVTYFIIGFIASLIFDYGKLFSGPILGTYMRPITDRWVMAGPLLQPLRGVIFAAVLFPLREALFSSRHGWLILWGLFAGLGIFSTFGPAPASVDGFIYTHLSARDHFVGLPEMLLQSLLLSLGLFYWVNYPQRRWFGALLYVFLAVEVILLTLGQIFKEN